METVSILYDIMVIKNQQVHVSDIILRTYPNKM